MSFIKRFHSMSISIQNVVWQESHVWCGGWVKGGSYSTGPHWSPALSDERQVPLTWKFTTKIILNTVRSITILHQYNTHAIWGCFICRVNERQVRKLETEVYEAKLQLAGLNTTLDFERSTATNLKASFCLCISVYFLYMYLLRFC